MENSLLHIENLSVQFTDTHGEKVPVLNDVSLSVNPQEIVCLVGESGSGKTVTALSILKLLDVNAISHTTGHVFFHQQDLLSFSPKAMEKIRGNEISMIFQEPLTALNPLFTIGTQITEAILTHENIPPKSAQQRTIELLIDVGFSDASSRLDAYPHQLSGGQRQRVMIAMALACNPSFLIADEPTTALDVTVQSQILRLLKTLQQKRNLSILYITHDLSLTAHLAHRIYVMYSGVIVESGHPADLFSNSKHPYTIGLLASLPNFQKRGQRLYNIPGNVPTPLSRPTGCPFHPRCTYRIPSCEHIFPHLRDNGDGHFSRCPVLFTSGASS